MFETRAMGYEEARKAQIELGENIRLALLERGFTSVAAPEYEAPGVVVVHTPSAEMVARFGRVGIQVAAGVKWMLEEHPQTQTFRVGLFGLEKWKDVKGTVKMFKESLSSALESKPNL
jgi:aspartate aminotransferase-like enzyme